jgi:hypothetical protein
MSAHRSRSSGRGGKGGAEPRARTRLRALHVMEQVLQGRPQAEIAAALGISQPAVSKIVRRIEEQLLADVAWKIERQRARQSLRLEFLYGESIRAWLASQQESLRRRQRKTDGGPGTGSTIAELVSENRHGDPRYFDAARNALADLRTLWGLNAPDQLSIEASAPFASMTDTALEAQLALQERLLHPVEPVTASTAVVPAEGAPR